VPTQHGEAPAPPSGDLVSALVGSPSGGLTHLHLLGSRRRRGSAYSGAGGQAQGGSVQGDGGLLHLVGLGSGTALPPLHTHSELTTWRS
jgi:hypothetical protein